MLLIVPFAQSRLMFTQAASLSNPAPSLGSITSIQSHDSKNSMLNQPSTAPLTYHQGPIQNYQNVYAIFWLPSGSHFELSGNDSKFESLISRYFNDVGGSNLSKLLVQYPDDINASPSTRVSFGGGFVDTTPYPHTGSVSDPLLGQDTTNEIEKIISSGSLPTGINDVYYVFTANGINICQDQLKAVCSFPTTQQPSGFCAYHSYFLSPFVAMPVNASGISGGCQLTTSILHSTGFPNNDRTVDSEINLISQEQVDTQTDPQSNAWYDTTSAQEISSKCAGQYGTVNATDGHNTVMNGHRYIIQLEWSNSIVSCTLTPPKTASLQINLLPSGASNVLSTSNFFALTYAIGNQLFVINDIGNPITIQADPNTSLSVAPMSSKSNINLEKWCFDSTCNGDVIALGAGGQQVTIRYYDLLIQYVYETTSDGSQPVGFATITYTTAPNSISAGDSPTPSSVALTSSTEGIWTERGSMASIISQTFTKSSTERWITPASSWTINQPSQIPLSISYHQYYMTYNYTTIGGGMGATGPQVSYYSEGIAQSVAVPSGGLQEWSDAGTLFTFGQTLGGSTAGERWVLSSGFGTGRVAAASTIIESYYNQYQVFASYRVVGANASAVPPTFAGYSFGSKITITISGSSTNYWLDAGSNYSFSNPLVGSNSSVRWFSTQISRGTVNSSLTKVLNYYQQFALSFSYRIVGGGSPPTLPSLNYSSLNQTSSLKLSVTSSPVWINAGSNFTVNTAMSAANSTERWAFNSASEFATSPGTITISLYHQYEVRFNVTISGGGAPPTLPTIKIISFGQQSSLQGLNGTRTVWSDVNSNYTLVSLLGASSTERWLTMSPASVEVSSALTSNIVYHHQYLVSLAYTVAYGNDSSGGPAVALVSFGTTESVTVNQTAGQVWADAGTPYTYPAQLPGSASGERWVSNSTLTGPVNSKVSANPQYNHQYMVTITTTPQGIPVLLSQQSGWYNSGASLDLSASPSRTWQFEGWQGTGPASFTGNRSELLLTVTAPISETAIEYAALTITASGTGS
ncbi:MAG: EXORDIUM family protein, partial [Thaumarchaeota archaeon]|nr:EXORDIUM family protein [Nitrososphaerota archaeon]